MADTLDRPASNDDREGWKAYWAAQDMPWRTEPEIDAERQRFLAERRAVQPDSEKSIYPFKDIALGRADLEWLLATHERGLWLTDTDFKKSLATKLAKRRGLDLRGANLRNANLARLPLMQLVGGTASDEWRMLTPPQRDEATIHLEGASLDRADLEEASLRFAHFEGANLRGARLGAAVLRGAHFEGAEQLAPADLSGAYLDASTKLDGAVLGNRKTGFATIVNVHWGGTDLSPLNWEKVNMIGEEGIARRRQSWRTLPRRGRASERIAEFQAAVQANRQMAVALRSQGLNEHADHFAFRAQLCQRTLLLRRRKLMQYVGSLLLGVVSGYGYKPMRSFITYALVILGFAAVYLALGGSNGHPLSWNEAIVVSMTAFHGRGFFAAVFQASDPQAAVAALEAFIGLLIEIVFIATFTQRFFAR